MKKYLPSKTFMKFFAVIIGIAVIIWLVSLIFSRSESYENKNQRDLISEADASIYSIDTDKDGVFDWEEGLWGTDYRKSDSNDDGVSDRDDIDARKRKIQAENNIEESKLDEKDLTQTELFARQFIATASLVDQSGGLSPEALVGFSDSLKKSIEGSTINDPFRLMDLKLSTVSSVEYKKSLAKAFDPYIKSGIMELEAVYRYSQGLPGAEADVDKLASLYADMSNAFLQMPAPHNLAGPHLGLVNNSAKITIALLNIRKLKEDPLAAMLGLKQYKEYSDALERNINSLAEYLN